MYFDKRRYYVIKEDEERIIVGTRTDDNCYQMNVVTYSFSMTAKVHDMELWHVRLGHVNYKLLHKH